MRNRNTHTTLWIWATIVVTLSAVTVSSVTDVQAEEEVAARVVYHNQKVEMVEVGDVPGHFVGITDQPGLMFVTKGNASGDVAVRKGTTYFDSVKGKGTSTGYVVYTFKDGSNKSYRATGTFSPTEGGGLTFEGTYEMTGGTGRFAGMKGKGTYKGERIGSQQTGQYYFDSRGAEWK